MRPTGLSRTLFGWADFFCGCIALVAQAAIDRQAEAMVLGQMLLTAEKRRKLEDGGCARKRTRGCELRAQQRSKPYAYASVLAYAAVTARTE
eukprot:231800-Pleurochrysis_carterae.AAC.1